MARGDFTHAFGDCVCDGGLGRTICLCIRAMFVQCRGINVWVYNAFMSSNGGMYGRSMAGTSTQPKLRVGLESSCTLAWHLNPGSQVRSGLEHTDFVFFSFVLFFFLCYRPHVEVPRPRMDCHSSDLDGCIGKVGHLTLQRGELFPCSLSQCELVPFMGDRRVMSRDCAGR